VNAAFLIVTTAWFAGADAAPATTAAPAVPPTAPVAAPMGGSCCGGGGGSYGGAYGGAYGGSGGCGCCEAVQCCKPSCLQRLKAKFQKNCCCESCNTCATTSCCNSGCGGHVASSSCCGSNAGCGGGHAASSGCCGSNYGGNLSSGCGTCCETTCCKQGFCARLKAKMQRNNCCNSCCETGCNSGCGSSGYGGSYGGANFGGAYSAPTVMPPAGEQIKAPKDANPPSKLPAGNPGKVQIQSNSLEVTPTSSNSFEKESKSPF
jgi:hypothetical protein